MDTQKYRMSRMTAELSSGRMGGWILKKSFGIEPYKSLTTVMPFPASTVLESTVATPIAITGPGM